MRQSFREEWFEFATQDQCAKNLSLLTAYYVDVGPVGDAQNNSKHRRDLDYILPDRLDIGGCIDIEHFMPASGRPDHPRRENVIDTKRRSNRGDFTGVVVDPQARHASAIDTFPGSTIAVDDDSASPRRSPVDVGERGHQATARTKAPISGCFC